MINLKLTVKYGDGTAAEVKTGPRTEVEFERKFNVGLVEAFQKEDAMRLEWLYFLAWHASKSKAPFDDWLDSIETVEVEGASAPDPSAATA